jgi:hypothetical protein
MADVYAVFGTLLALGIAFPGLLTGSWLLFPDIVSRARLRVAGTPWRSFVLGVAAVLLTSILVIALNAIPIGIAKLVALLTILGAFGVATLGAAALAAEMGDRLRAQSPSSLSSPGAFVRGAVALELAAAFPIVGWFLVIPGVLLLGFGAGLFGLVRWLPRPRMASAAPRSETLPSRA